MPKTRPVYEPEFRQQMEELVRAGRTQRELAKEFEPSEPTVRSWEAVVTRGFHLLDGPAPACLSTPV